MMPGLLFVYGTLHPDRAPVEIAETVQQLRPVGRATIQGCRHELGDYPGVVLSDHSGEIAVGEVFALPGGPEAEEALARFDAYEGYRADDPAGSLFLRRTVTATMEDGSRRQCWVYTYNLRLPK